MKTSEAGITVKNSQQSLCHAVTGRQYPKPHEILIKLTKLKMIDNIITLIINLLLWRVFLTFIDRDNHETV